MSRKRKTYPFEEGECVALGLPSGGYALIVVARVSRKTNQMLVYAFAPRYPTLPDPTVMTTLHPNQAIDIELVDLYKIEELMRAVPPVHRLGRLPNWQREQWKVPPCVEIVTSEPLPFLEYYDDETLEFVERVAYPVEQLIGGRYLWQTFVVFDAFVRAMDKYVDQPPDPNEWVESYYRRRKEMEEHLQHFREWLACSSQEAEEVQAMNEADRQALQKALEAGLSADTPQLFEHYLYFERRQQAAEALQSAGYQVVVRRSAGGSEWLVLASQPLLPTEEDLDPVIEFMEEVAARYGGEYDGWGVAVSSEQESG